MTTPSTLRPSRRSSFKMESEAATEKTAAGRSGSVTLCLKTSPSDASADALTSDSPGGLAHDAGADTTTSVGLLAMVVVASGAGADMSGEGELDLRWRWLAFGARSLRGSLSRATTSLLPFSRDIPRLSKRALAKSRAVSPSLSRSVGSAPRSRRRLAIAKWPSAAA